MSGCGIKGAKIVGSVPKELVSFAREPVTSWSPVPIASSDLLKLSSLMDRGEKRWNKVGKREWVTTLGKAIHTTDYWSQLQMRMHLKQMIH